MKYSGVFFDFDYTLGDATEAIVAGFLYGLHTLGYPIPDREAIRHTIGLTLKDGFTTLTGVTDEAQREEFAKLYRFIGTPAQIATAALCPGAEELLTTLHDRGVKLAVVSSKPGPILEKILVRQGVAPLFDLIIGADAVKAAKPAPDGIFAALKATGLTKDQILYCGDTVIDAEAAKNAGVDFCPVLNGTTEAPAFEAWPKVHLSPTLDDLREWLTKEELV